MLTRNREAEVHALAPGRGTWLVELFRSIDAMDASRFAALFAEDGRFRLGNDAPVGGREQIEHDLAEMFSMVDGLDNDIVGIWSGRWDGGDVLSVEIEVSYLRLDGSRTPVLPATTTIRLAGDLICDYRIFIDMSPLFGPW